MVVRTSLGWLVVVGALTLGLYLLKYDVQTIRDANHALKAKINEEQMAISMLNAEWVYLNRPERLSELAERYLQLQPMKPKAVVSWNDIPRRESEVASAMEPR